MKFISLPPDTSNMIAVCTQLSPLPPSFDTSSPNCTKRLKVLLFFFCKVICKSALATPRRAELRCLRPPARVEMQPGRRAGGGGCPDHPWPGCRRVGGGGSFFAAVFVNTGLYRPARTCGMTSACVCERGRRFPAAGPGSARPPGRRGRASLTRERAPGTERERVHGLRTQRM